MQFVEVYKLNSDGSQRVIAVCRLVEGGAVCEGEEIFVKNLGKEGIFDYSSSKSPKIFPKDGLRFLEQLKFNFKSGYLNASDVEESN